MDIIMARRCDICGKGTVAGQVVPRKGKPKKEGGVGQHIGVTKKREFRPNLVTIDNNQRHTEDNKGMYTLSQKRKDPEGCIIC